MPELTVQDLIVATARCNIDAADLISAGSEKANSLQLIRAQIAADRAGTQAEIDRYFAAGGGGAALKDIAVIRMSGYASGTHPLTLANMVPNGPQVNSWGNGRNPGAEGGSPNAPFGDGMYLRAADNGYCMMGLEGDQVINGELGMEKFIRDLDNYQPVASFSTDGTDNGQMSLKWISRNNGDGSAFFNCYGQLGGPGTGFEAFPETVSVPKMMLPGGFMGFHIVCGLMGRKPVLSCNGVRLGLGTADFGTGPLSGKIAFVGHYDYVAEQAAGTIAQEVSMARVRLEYPYPGTTYTVPTAPFTPS